MPKPIHQLHTSHGRRPGGTHIELHEARFAANPRDRALVMKDHNGHPILAEKGRKVKINGVTAHTVRVFKNGKMIEAYVWKDPATRKFHLVKYTPKKKGKGKNVKTLKTDDLELHFKDRNLKLTGDRTKLKDNRDTGWA